MNFHDYVGLIMAGILSLLWWDIRNIRGEVRDFRAGRKEIDETFMSKADHQLICENSLLRMEVNTAKVVAAATKEIMAAIKANGNGK